MGNDKVWMLETIYGVSCVSSVNDSCISDQSPQNHGSRDICRCLACLCLVSPNYLTESGTYDNALRELKFSALLRASSKL